MTRRALGAVMTADPPEVGTVAVRRWTVVPFPVGATTDTATCTTRIALSPSGRPTSVEVTGCDAPFAAITRATLGTWRWVPPSADGERVPATATLEVPFRRP